jgi:N-acetylneuraminic acid mutarotase
MRSELRSIGKTALVAAGLLWALLPLLAGCGAETTTVAWPHNPIASGVYPDEGPLQGGSTVTVFGFGFKAGIAVEFGGIPASSVTLVSSTELSCVTPGGTTPGAVDLKIWNPGGEANDLANAYTYVAWFDLAWSCRRPIPVQGSLAGDQSDYQVKVVLDFDPDMQPDFSDLRFTQRIGAIEVSLGYWIETFTTAVQATAWVKMASIPSTGTTLYAYYGNASASSASDFDQTFSKDLGEGGLLGLWHLDEGTGFFAADSSGRSVDGTLCNVFPPHGWSGVDGGTWGTRDDVRFSTGSSLLLDGVDDFVDTTGTVAPTTALSVEGWVKSNLQSFCGKEQVIASKWQVPENLFATGSSWSSFDPSAWGVGVELDGYIGGAFDGRYVYFSQYYDGTQSGEFMRYDTHGAYDSPLSWEAFDPGDNAMGVDPDGYHGAIFDGRYVYFIPHHNGSRYHAEIVRFDTRGSFLDTASWTVFDPTAGSSPVWTSGADMSAARGHCGAAEVNGKIYVMGGYLSGSVATNEEYDVALDSWATLTPLPAVRHRPGVAATGGLVYVVGGRDDSTARAEIYSYDPSSDSWDTTLNSMPGILTDMACEASGNYVYAIGGWNDVTYQNSTLIYNISTDSWSTGAAMPTARRYMTSCMLGTKIYVIGGNNGGYLNLTEVYDTATNTWETRAPVPYAAHGQGCCAIDGKVYVFGGYSGARRDWVFCYDPVTNTWDRPMTHMLSVREWFAHVEYNGKFYAFGGNQGSYTAYTQIYDPSLESEHHGAHGFSSGYFDGRFVYCSPYYNGIYRHCDVLRFDTTRNFNSLSSWEVYSPARNGFDAVQVTGYYGGPFDGQYIYFCPYHNNSTYHCNMLRYNTRAPFDSLSSWETINPQFLGFGTNPAGYVSAVYDGRFVYYIPYHNGGYHGEFLRYDTRGDFTDLLSWRSFDPGSAGVGIDPDGYWGGSFDGRYIYFCPRHNGGWHGEVIRYDTFGSFDQTSSWTAIDAGGLGIGDTDGYNGSVFDGRYVYLVPYHNGSDYHGLTVRIDTLGEEATFKLVWSQADQAGGWGSGSFGPAGFVNTDAGIFSVHANSHFDAGAWHHVAMTYDGATLRLYVDGSEAASEAATGTLCDSSAPVQLGSFFGGSNNLNGTLDEVRVHDRALPAEEVLAHSQRRKYVYPEPVVGTVGDEEYK